MNGNGNQFGNGYGYGYGYANNQVNLQQGIQQQGMEQSNDVINISFSNVYNFIESLELIFDFYIFSV